MFKSELLFEPDDALLSECPEFFDAETGAFTALITAKVDSQALPCELTVLASVTPSGVTVSHDAIDFGEVSVYESAQLKVANCGDDF